MAKTSPQNIPCEWFDPCDWFDPADLLENLEPSREPAEKPKGKSKKKGGKSQGKRNKELGRHGEEAAVDFLQRKGYAVLERNWTCYAGEADIVATDGANLVFVEVKTRRGADKGFPAEAVNAKKREKYERIALIYVRDHCIGDVSVRFDVVSVVVVAPHRAMIRHHLGAFNTD